MLITMKATHVAGPRRRCILLAVTFMTRPVGSRSIQRFITPPEIAGGATYRIFRQKSLCHDRIDRVQIQPEWSPDSDPSTVGPRWRTINHSTNEVPVPVRRSSINLILPCGINRRAVPGPGLTVVPACRGFRTYKTAFLRWDPIRARLCSTEIQVSV